MGRVLSPPDFIQFCKSFELHFGPSSCKVRDCCCEVRRMIPAVKDGSLLLSITADRPTYRLYMI